MAAAIQTPPTLTSPVLISSKQKLKHSLNRKTVLVSASLLMCTLQLLWFASKCIHQIDADAISYTGIASELKQGLFHVSINGFRSPLISWLMAAIPGLPPFQSGKLITILMYVGTVVLLYAFTKKLWHSDVIAGFAALMFVVARGVAFDAVALISADFLFAVLTLVYFWILLDCLREDRHWFLLGCVHGLAFLAKAFALPWLALMTFGAVLASSGKRDGLKRLAAAATIPILAAALWASILHSKYGSFTTGTQFKTNFLQWTLREYRNHRPQTYSALLDIRASTDEHMVTDPMAPGSWGWSYKLNMHRVFPKIIQAEIVNIPLMMKELAILSNPGILLGFALILAFAFRSGGHALLNKDARIMIAIVVIAAISLVLAYCMLVVDERYLLPLVPLIIAIGSRFMIKASSDGYSLLRLACWVLAVVSFAWTLVYSSSPFRVQKQDFQAICYQAGDALKQNSGSDVVSIGSGPFPEHGVGWEAGYKAAYFGGKRLIATEEKWPSQNEMSLLQKDLEKANPSAILVWNRDDSSRQELLTTLKSKYSEKTKIVDPSLGDVGVVLFRQLQLMNLGDQPISVKFTPNPGGTPGAPSLRSLQGWELRTPSEGPAFWEVERIGHFTASEILTR